MLLLKELIGINYSDYIILSDLVKLKVIMIK